MREIKYLDSPHEINDLGKQLLDLEDYLTL